MSSDEQLAQWAEGDSVHNPERDECCPDFSCCCPEIRASDAERAAFLAADEPGRHAFLGAFLGRLVARLVAASTPKKVLIVG